ncbi:GntR family transcriptional regulator [Amaricoccus macauensis]|uniref:GntR family transcriptional regulator n=1 Tax=Amaricoccus macauensis TaxID=57001 RepID=UPI003C7C0A62
MEETLYTRILRAVGAEIARGDLAPGERLMENRLANRFGVSRAPARQALAEMEDLGLVAQAEAPARGFVVTTDAAERAALRFAAHPPEPFSAETTPAWQLIYSDIEKALTRRIAFGSWRVVESALGRHYGVSRTVAREVLARLQSCGLVVNEGKRWIAPELTEKRVHELYDLRALLEPAALAEVGANVPTDLLDGMIRDLHTVMTDRSGGPTLDQLEADLHFGLLGRCRNSLLRKTMVESQSLLLAHRFFYQHTSEMYPVEPFLDEHLQVLELLRAGAVPEACEGLRAHLVASSHRAVARIALIRDAFRDTPPAYLEPIETSN